MEEGGVGIIRIERGEGERRDEGSRKAAARQGGIQMGRKTKAREGPDTDLNIVRNVEGIRTFSSSLRFSLRFFRRRAISARRIACSSAVRCFLICGSVDQD